MNSFKILFLGASNIRMKLLLWMKCIIEKSKDPDFNQHIPSGFDMLSLTCKYKEEEYRLSLWDVSDSKELTSIRPLNYQGAHLFVFIYDVHNLETFDVILDFLDEVQFHR